jgi:hypothetical protein
MDGQAQSISPQQRYARLRNWCIGLAVTAAGVTAFYLWLDQPIAFFVQRNVADKTVFVWLQLIPVAFLLLSFFVLAWCGLRTLMDRPFSRVQSLGMACTISFISTNLITNQLKYAFGRTWPETWIENNPSLIQNGAFCFQSFTRRPWLRVVSIGSCGRCLCGDDGVVVVIREFASDLCRLCSRGCGWLIGANYHFLSDILSVIFVGVSVGYVTTKMSPSTRDLS